MEAKSGYLFTHWAEFFTLYLSVHVLETKPRVTLSTSRWHIATVGRVRSFLGVLIPWKYFNLIESIH